MSDLVPDRPPRKMRAWWKVLASWIVGAVTDPHRHTTSSARLISFAMTYTLHIYLTRTPAPDYRIVAILVTGGIIPLIVRTKSTDKSQLLLPRLPTAPAPEAP